MTRWTAILPLKLSADRKSRLAPVLSLEERRRLGDRMASHVIAELGSLAAIYEIIILSPQVVTSWPVRTVVDHGRGLNAELDAVALTLPGPLLIVHGDLPLVAAQDIKAMLDAPEAAGCAIAPDRHGQGTNALALHIRPDGFGFAFGPNSFARHQRRLEHNMAVIRREGLACDIDTPDDLTHAQTIKLTLSD